MERVQNRGARVRAVSSEEAVEITEIRMVVEGLCAAKAAERATEENRAELRAIAARMREAVAAGDLLGYADLNLRLHALILEISGGRTAREVLDRLRTLNVHHQFRLSMVPGRPQVSLPQHLAIVDAVCAGDADGAEAAVRAHLRSVIEALPGAERAGNGHGAR